ncbi:MAG: restriction endonuclease subunit M, partial [Pseudomonadota bacterium]
MNADRYKPLVERDFLKSELHYEYQDYLSSGEDEKLRLRLEEWRSRELTGETQAEAAFTRRFFHETWGYSEDGAGSPSFQIFPKFTVAGAGQTGNRGEADLALGNFTGSRDQTPQVLVEFKGIKSDLDAPQRRKGNTRSPVMQARDYLWNARRGMFGN